MQLKEIPFFMAVAEWVWSADPSPEVTPESCLSSVPLLSSQCFSRLLVKAVGIAIILGACLNKAPLFVNVLKSKSVAGLSTAAVYGEVLLYSNAAFYGVLRGNPFTAWGETGAIVVQSIVMAFFVWHYKDDPRISFQEKALAVAVYAGYIFGVLVILPPDSYYLLQASNWPVLVYSRGSQIIETFRLKHTGTQSIITNTMNVVGTFVRILTTIKEVGWDVILLASYGISLVLNVILWSQFFFYRANTAKVMASLAEKKKE